MSKLHIIGGTPLRGEVTISGAKNAAIAIIPAALLVDGPCRFDNIPRIDDVHRILDILKDLGSTVTWEDDYSVTIDCTNVTKTKATDEKAQKMRASYYLLGALLGRSREATVALPGGCNFGNRPIDLHLKGFEAMGASIKVHRGTIAAKAGKLEGAEIFMDKISVGATINIMLAATKAEGTTLIKNAAKEPHVVDLANFLNARGAKVTGAGTDTIKIIGVETLTGGPYEVIPDQIEAGTYMIAAAATGGDVLVKNVIPRHMEPLSAKLLEAGARVESTGDSIQVSATLPLKGITLETQPYPGFPTDLQPQMVALLTTATGQSKVLETVWDNRFQYVGELKRMDAQITVNERVATITGVDGLYGASVKATDLRAGAAMVIAGLMAEGETVVDNLRFIRRGYEQITEKLEALGANITIEECEENA